MSERSDAGHTRAGRLLELRNVSAGYGNSVVLDDLSLQVEEGKTCVVLGPNGAGKSTLLDTVCAMVGWRRGTIMLGDIDISQWKTHRLAAAGIGYSPQGRRLFQYMSTEANLLLGAYCRHDRAAVKTDVASFVADWPLVEQRMQHPGGVLSGGEQQVVAIGRALMSRPRLLLLDEPSLGLAPRLVSVLYETIRGLVRDRGQTLLIVEQNVTQALSVADHVVVLVGGRIVRQGPADAFDHDEIVNLYFHGAVAAGRD